MTEQELREKIKQIVAPYVSAWGDDERIADSLIANGIGDVSEWKHRAEVAERALIDCVEYYSYSALCPVLDCNYNKACWRKECTSDIVKCFKIQAKKELAEEGKDD